MRELDKVLNDGEKVFWEGRPKFWPFFLSYGVSPLTIIVIFWTVIIVGAFFQTKGEAATIRDLFLIPHFFIGVAIVLLPSIYAIFSYKRTYYAITDKRTIIQTGIVGRDFKIVDFDKVANAEVNVGFWDKICGRGSGSVFIFTAGSPVYSKHGNLRPNHRISNVENPYEVFKFFKKVSHDVKTDIEYPNALRPGQNPGYKTDYDPGEAPKA